MQQTVIGIGSVVIKSMVMGMKKELSWTCLSQVMPVGFSSGAPYTNPDALKSEQV